MQRDPWLSGCTGFIDIETHSGANTMNRFLIFIAFLSLAACASMDRDTRPDWLDGSSTQYPAQRFVTGIGIADDLATARDRARADLAKTFRVSIDARSSDSERYREQQDGAGSTMDYSADVQRDLATRTQQVLEG